MIMAGVGVAVLDKASKDKRRTSLVESYSMAKARMIAPAASQNIAVSGEWWLVSLVNSSNRSPAPVAVIER